MSTVPSSTETSASKPRILVVDDEPMIISALQRELRQSPYELIFFTDPLVVPKAFAQGAFDLVISDNLMPGMTGLELMAWVKENHPLTRRVLLTGRTDLNQAVKSFNEGAIHRFLNKPWNKAELLEVIEAELRQYRATSEERMIRSKLEVITQQRTVQLLATREELKQARTQLFMYEEGPSVTRMALSSRMRKLSILVVDEHAGVRELLVASLKKAGMSKVQAVAGGDEALAYLQSTPLVDVVLSEWKMAGLDGLSLFRTLREEGGPTANALFILITTRENRNEVEHALKAGVDGYLLKPFRLKTLLERVESLLPKGPKESLEEKIQELRPLSVIVANLDLDSRFAIQQILVGGGIQNVVTADSGQKVLRLLKEKKADVLVYDCNVRDPYWLQLDWSLRTENPDGPSPAMVITSVAPMPKEYDEVQQAGLAAFLPGPPQRRELFHGILRALEARQEAGTHSLSPIS